MGCSDDNFCVDNFSFQDTNVPIGEVTFTLPTGTTYSGMGALPYDMTIGDYEGKIQSVITSETQTQYGLDVELVHFFSDEGGNSFWTSDHAVFTPIDQTFTTFTGTDTMTVVDGRGDFQCASGRFLNTVTLKLAAQSLDLSMTGNVCGGCE